jgi:ribonuclease HI
MLLSRTSAVTQVWLAQVDWFLSYFYFALTAITALAKSPTELAQVWESVQALEKLIVSNKVPLEWIPWHHGIPGNEEADKLAKEGTNAVPPVQTVGIHFVVSKEVIRSHRYRST